MYFALWNVFVTNFCNCTGNGTCVWDRDTIYNT